MDFEGFLCRILDGCYDNENGFAQFHRDVLDHYGWQHEETFRVIRDKHMDLSYRERLEEILGEFVKAI